MRFKLERTIIDAILLILVVVAAFTDYRSGKVYNALTFPAMASGLALNWVFRGGDGLSDSIRACLIAFAVLIAPVAVRGVGAGDLKLLVAVGALEGVQFMLNVFFWSAILAGALSVLILSQRRFSFVLALPGIWHLSSVRSLPFAVAMALGSAIALYTR